MARKYFVVLKGPGGSSTRHRMKEWLRRHPEMVPDGFHATRSTSQELRGALKKNGWRCGTTSDSVLLFPPDGRNYPSFADELRASEVHDGADNEAVQEAEEITFGLERDLQMALRRNIEQLESGLKVHDGGMERVTEAGRVDITAIDKDGQIVVIELKAGTAAPSVMTQVLAYMASIAETEAKPVRGIIVAGDFDKRVLLASRAISNLELRQYAFQFTFRPME